MPDDGSTMRAAVLVAPRRFELRDVPVPRPRAHEVLLRVSAVGLCGSDFHIYSGESNYNLDEDGRPIPLSVEPLVMGHEFTGTVVRVGDAVDDVTPGQRVVVDQGMNCHSFGHETLCEYCATGDSHQCEHYVEHGITGLQGGLAEMVATPAVNVVPLTSRLTPAEVAMTEPLACVLHSSDAVVRSGGRYRLAAQDPEREVRSVLICGSGPAGLLFAQVLRRVLGFEGRIIVSEPDDDKRARAAALGADVVDPVAQDLSLAVAELTGGRRVEYLIDASGAGQVFRDIPAVIRKQGTVLLYGHGHGGVGMELLNQVQWREPNLVSPIGASGGFDSDRRPEVYRRALRLIEEGTVDVGSMVTHRYTGLDQVPGAFSGDHGQPGYVKGVVLLDD